jgi:hypothetical protein
VQVLRHALKQWIANTANPTSSEKYRASLPELRIYLKAVLGVVFFS